MNAAKVFGTVLLLAVIFTILGSLIGGILGVAVPDYYRFAFRDGQSPEFNPLHTGIGLGAVQGFAAGIVVALVVLVILALHDVGTQAKEPALDKNQGVQKRRWGLLAVWFVTTSLAVILFSFAAYAIGLCAGTTSTYEAWRNRKLEKVAAILEAEKLSDLETHHCKPVQVRLDGTVPSEEAFSTLHEKLILTFGTEEAEHMLQDVKVAEQPQ